MSESSPFIGGLANYYSYSEDKLRGKIKEVKTIWQNIKGTVKGKPIKKGLKSIK